MPTSLQNAYSTGGNAKQESGAKMYKNIKGTFMTRQDFEAWEKRNKLSREQSGKIIGVAGKTITEKISVNNIPKYWHTITVLVDANRILSQQVDKHKREVNELSKKIAFGK